MKRARLAVLVCVAMAVACHRFDAAQVPSVSVGKGLWPTITWGPSPAYELMVYAGDTDGNGIGALWTARGPGGYENTLTSPVTYGTSPAGTEMAPAVPLTAGRIYTVTVRRTDERGGGDGFFNTRHRYIGTRTFVAGEGAAASR